MFDVVDAPLLRPSPVARPARTRLIAESLNWPVRKGLGNGDGGSYTGRRLGTLASATH
jgi:hypothetical protein